MFQVTRTILDDRDNRTVEFPLTHVQTVNVKTHLTQATGATTPPAPVTVSNGFRINTTVSLIRIQPAQLPKCRLSHSVSQKYSRLTHDVFIWVNALDSMV